MKKEENNPMHYCLSCPKYLGFRGFCSQKCHDKYYDLKKESAAGGLLF